MPSRCSEASIEAMTCLRERPRPFSPGIVWHAHLRRDDELLAGEELRQHPPGDDLALAAVVDVGGVEERDPALDRAPDDRLRVGLGERPRPLSCAPKLIIPRHTRETRRPGVAEVHVLHGGLLPSLDAP